MCAREYVGCIARSSERYRSSFERERRERRIGWARRGKRKGCRNAIIENRWIFSSTIFAHARIGYEASECPGIKKEKQNEKTVESLRDRNRWTRGSEKEGKKESGKESRAC